MQAFHFGSSKAPLFGVYHPPPTGGGAGIVMCQPIGHEYIRAHRALRNLAVRLSASGFHVLRFDYFGCGDSAGGAVEGTLARWHTDIATAIDELKDMAGLNRVSLLGVRFGATLAALAASTRRDVDSLVLWDPVPQGRLYIEDVTRLQDEWAKARPWLNLTASEHDEMMGFPLTEEMRAAFEAIDLSSLTAWPARKIALLSSCDSRMGHLAEQIGRHHAAITVQQIDCDCQWYRPEAAHLALLANEMVQSTTAVFEGRGIS